MRKWPSQDAYDRGDAPEIAEGAPAWYEADGTEITDLARVAELEARSAAPEDA